MEIYGKNKKIMIDNVITISDFHKGDLKRIDEYWSKATYDEMENSVIQCIKEKRGFLPRANMKMIREISFQIKASTSIDQLRKLSNKIQKKYDLDCFQISIDRSNSIVHMLFSFINQEGQVVKFDWLMQIKISAIILRTLNLPRPISVRLWMRYFLYDAYEEDPQIFMKQLDAIEHGDIKRIDIPFMRDVLQYAEAMCKGQVK